ncbi:hypothetical protein SPF06_17910 [Sinomonas sp. JGH33]|uniref:Uncharacterized protein n=1 Tax=Sinomonas terricola TaxID=3110330 RepID=A0ABU5TA87_9MICC|nr:hypothetical protein [Sinomonas sp. JGH33]MEA5456604.1 hypothetical protein [Sinomonas sp. JGH33]
MSSQHPPPVGGRTTAASDAALKAALHRLFDGQIPNYASYNLVCAAEAGGTIEPEPGSLPGAPVPLGMVLGYRRRPAELVIAPFDRRTLTPAGRPSTIDLTNLAYAEEATRGAFDIGTNMGRIFCFTVRSRCTLDGPDEPAPRTIEQDDDAEDFAAFMRDLAEL